MIITVLFTLGSFLYLALIVLNEFNKNPDLKHNYFQNTAKWYIVRQILIAFLLFITVFLILDMNLVVFHIYLSRKGITTYEFIKRRKIRRARKVRSKQREKVTINFFLKQLYSIKAQLGRRKKRRNVSLSQSKLQISMKKIGKILRLR